MYVLTSVPYLVDWKEGRVMYSGHARTTQVGRTVQDGVGKAIPVGHNGERGMAQSAVAETRLQSGGRPLWPLAAARVIIGILWHTQGLCDWLNKEIQHPAVPVYGSFVHTLVLPNIGFLGWVVWLVEASIMVSLVLGLLTRLGGLVGLLQGLNLLIGLAAVPGEWYWSYAMLALFQALFLLLAPGRVFGIDAILRPVAKRSGSALARAVLLAT